MYIWATTNSTESRGWFQRFCFWRVSGYSGKLLLPEGPHLKYSISALHSSKRNDFLLESKELDQWLLSQKRLQCQMYFGSCIPSPLELEGEGTRGTQEEICLHSQECETKKKKNQREIFTATKCCFGCAWISIGNPGDGKKTNRGRHLSSYLVVLLVVQF